MGTHVSRFATVFVQRTPGCRADVGGASEVPTMFQRAWCWVLFDPFLESGEISPAGVPSIAAFP